MDSLNPENKCSDLKLDSENLPNIEEMFKMQKSLQDALAKSGKALDFDTSTFKQRVDEITTQWRNMNLEMSELLERLPYKEWRNYTDEQKSGFISKEQELETLFEYIDVFHFFLNIGLCLGIDGELFKALYKAKNKENFERQKRGY